MRSAPSPRSCGDAARGASWVMLPRAKARGFRFDRRPRTRTERPAPHGAELLLRRAPVGEPSTACRRGFHGECVRSTHKENLSGVQVRVVEVAARDAQVDVLLSAASRIDHAARATGLRGVVGGDFDHPRALHFRLVAQHRHEPTPPRVEDGAVQARLLRDVHARFFDRALCAAGHVLHEELLHDHRAVALGVVMGLDAWSVRWGCRPQRGAGRASWTRFAWSFVSLGGVKNRGGSHLISLP